MEKVKKIVDFMYTVRLAVECSFFSDLTGNRWTNVNVNKNLYIINIYLIETAFAKKDYSPNNLKWIGKVKFITGKSNPKVGFINPKVYL